MELVDYALFKITLTRGRSFEAVGGILMNLNTVLHTVSVVCNCSDIIYFIQTVWNILNIVTWRASGEHSTSSFLSARAQGGMCNWISSVVGLEQVCQTQSTQGNIGAIYKKKNNNNRPIRRPDMTYIYFLLEKKKEVMLLWLNLIIASYKYELHIMGNTTLSMK